MITGDIFDEDLLGSVIRYGLVVGAALQLACVLACLTLSHEQSDPYAYEVKTFTDSDDWSSEQSSPGHRASLARARRHDKKKRR